MSTINVLTDTESGANSLSDINDNFEALNTDKVETSVTVNGHALSSNVVVTNADLGAVPTTRTVNGKALSGNITLGLASADFANQGTTTTVLHGNASGNPAFGAVVEADITLATSNTTNDVSTTKHGFVPTAPNDTAKFLRGDGTWAVPTDAASVYASTIQDITVAANSGTGNNDTTITCGFQPAVIVIYYKITGYDGAEKYTRGTAVYSGTTLINNNAFLTNVNGGTAITDSTWTMDTTAPSAGTSAATKLLVTLSVASVSSTGCVVRIARDAQQGSDRHSYFQVIAYK